MGKYRLIIADDERFIRDSLMELVDWERLGYEVVFCGEDGTQVIDYLNENGADVVFSDIQMRNTTGLDVAKFIYENVRQVRVVLLSGYQEFEFAKKAIAYDVEEYLLKPISITEIEACFLRVRVKLDQQRREKEKQLEMTKNIQNYEEGILEKLFELIQIGILRDMQSVSDYLGVFGLMEKFKDMYCFEIQLRVDSCSEDDVLELNALNNMINMYCKEYQMDYILTMYGQEPDNYRIIVFSNHKIDGEWVREVSAGIMELCGIRVHFEMETDWGLFPEFAEQLIQAEPDSLLAYQEDKPQNDIEAFTAIAKQFLLILNMSEEEEQITKKITEIYFESICYLTESAQETCVRNVLQHMEELREESGTAAWQERSAFTRDGAESIKQYFDRNIRYFYRRIHQTAPQISMVRQIRTLLEENVTRTVSLKEAADKVFLSPNYFSRIFREQSGENFSDFCIRIKMEKAAELLCQPQYKVYEVCDLLGYKNIKYFYKLFKRIYNCTPSEYRSQRKLEE